MMLPDVAVSVGAVVGGAACQFVTMRFKSTLSAFVVPKAPNVQPLTGLAVAFWYCVNTDFVDGVIVVPIGNVKGVGVPPRAYC